MCKLRDDTMSQAGELPMEKKMDEGFSRPLKDFSAAEVAPQSSAAVRGEAVAEARPLYWAAINCAHLIEDSYVTLYRNRELAGNALSQLGDRLDSAAASLAGPASADVRGAGVREAMPIELTPQRIFGIASAYFAWMNDETPCSDWENATQGRIGMPSLLAFVKAVSDRAADAPSEPTNAAHHARLVLIRELGGAELAESVRHGKVSIRAALLKVLGAADALDSQPTVPTVRPDQCTEAQRNAVYMALHWYMQIPRPDEWKATDEAIAAFLAASPASSQPTDGGVRK